MKKLLFLSSCILFLGLTSCSINGNTVDVAVTALPAPINVRVENDNYVYWDEVPNASSYVLKINGSQENTGNALKYSIAALMDSKIEANIPTELHIFVKAKGNQILFSDSEWSTEITYTYTKVANSGNKEKLPTPRIIRNEHHFEWDAVSNAVGYTISYSINNGDFKEATTASNSFDFSYSANCLYSIKFKANAASDSNYLDSDWTSLEQDIEYKLENEVLLDFKNTVVKNGIGQSISTIDGEYGVVEAGRYESVFEPNAIYNMTIYETVLNEASSQTTARTEITDALLDIGAKVGFTITKSADRPFENIVPWSKSFSIGFEASANYARTNNTKSVYISSIVDVRGKLVTIQGRTNVSKFRNAVSDDFLLAAKNVKNEYDAEQLLGLYGTHVVTAGLFGGRAEAYYTYLYESTNTQIKVDQTLELQFGKHIEETCKRKTSGTTINEEFHLNKNVTTTNDREYFYAKLKGSTSPQPATTQQGFADNLSDWLDGFKDGKYPTLVDFPEESLISVWDLLPETNEYSSQRELLKNTCIKNINEEFEKCKSIYYSPELSDANGLVNYKLDENRLVFDLSSLQEKGGLDKEKFNYKEYDGEKLIIYPRWSGYEVDVIDFVGGYGIRNDKGIKMTSLLSNLSIEFDSSWYKNPTINFKNFGFESNSIGLDLSMVSSEYKCNINYIGDNKIVSQNDAIVGNNYQIDGKESGVLYIEVKEQPKAPSDTDGKNGGNGIYSIENEMLAISNIKLSVIAGKGGEGGTGSNGGGNNYGKKGGTGGNGGDAIKTNKLYLSNCEIIKLEGGAGGKGGKSGESKCGGIKINETGVKGGTGGNGGNAISSSDITFESCQYSSEKLIAGAYGEGGQGGAWNGEWAIGCSRGPDGDSGTSGQKTTSIIKTK